MPAVAALGLSASLHSTLRAAPRRCRHRRARSRRAGVRRVEGLKYAVGRARPTAGGEGEFQAGSSEDRFKSFPSRHTALMWAAVTPYAKEFGMPWLYGVAALTNAARVGSREHWLSDTVAGSVLGYALGTLAGGATRVAARENAPALAIGRARWGSRGSCRNEKNVVCPVFLLGLICARSAGLPRARSGAAGELRRSVRQRARGGLRQRGGDRAVPG